MDMEGHVWLAQGHKQGGIPATILCNARSVLKFFKTWQPASCAGDLQAMAYQIRSMLLDTKRNGGAALLVPTKSSIVRGLMA